jgi:trans-aconitate methyltransferase
MRHRDAVAMLAGARVPPWPSTWADLGAGNGTFTLALAELLPQGSLIHATDVDAGALARIPPSPHVRIEKHVGDFTTEWPFDRVLDGILMANSLHFVSEQSAFLVRCAARLSPSASFLVVEYDTDVSNPWVPYPASFGSLSRRFASVGFERVERLSSRRSRYQRASLYSAVAWRG